MFNAHANPSVFSCLTHEVLYLLFLWHPEIGVFKPLNVKLNQK